MKFYSRKIITIALLISFFGLNFCFANTYPQQYGNNIEAQLEEIFQEQQNQDSTSEEAEDYGYLKAGDNLAIELEDTIDSETASIGDEVRAKLVFPLEINNKIIAPEGSIVSGKITKLRRKGIWYQNAKAQVVFEEIDCGEDLKLPIVANIKTKDNSSMLLGADKSKQFQEISSLLAITSIGGALAGFGFGLLMPYPLVGGVIGAVSGFSLGLGWLFFHKGQPINLPSGTKLVITLENDVAVSGEI
ncbi:MAG: hypothetical protein WCF95_01860 [bacterium]